MHFSAKCNSGRIAIQWFHIKHYLDYQYSNFQPYTFSGGKNVCFWTIRDFGSPTNIRDQADVCEMRHPKQYLEIHFLYFLCY